MRRAVILLASLALLLAGCTVMTPETEGLARCQDRLQYEIEQALPEPAAGWLESEVTVDTVAAAQRGTETAWDFQGTAIVTMVDESTMSVEWTCYSQTIDGKTYSALQTINGICTTTKKKAVPEQCP